MYAPYQLLIVGDPLCRPWANIPRVSVAGVEAGAVVRGSPTLKPSATVGGGAPVDRFELFADGFRWGTCKPGEDLPLDTTKLADGYHELRVVAIGSTPIESQGRTIVPVQVNNHDRKITASLGTQSPLYADQPITVVARSPGSKAILIFHGIRPVGQIVGDAGQAEIPANARRRTRPPGRGRVGRRGTIDVCDGHPAGLHVATPGSKGRPLMHEHFMRIALDEAQQALRENEVPIGAAIVHEGRLIAQAHNQREQLHDPTAHAEMIAITQAAEARQSWRLEGCTLYVTLEPCPMCAGAILQARIPMLVYGAADPKAGAVDSLYRLLNDPRLNHSTESLSGVLAEPCGQILSQFFQEQRRLGKK